jgi:hypothetical protein
MFNVLIAIVSEVYDKTIETAEVDVRKRKAEVMIHEEALMTTAELENPDYFPEFLEVLANQMDFEDVLQPKNDDGSGSSPDTSELKESIAKVEGQMREQHEAITAIQTGQEAMAAAMRQEMGELRAMLAQVVQVVQ